MRVDGILLVGMTVLSGDDIFLLAEMKGLLAWDDG